MRNKQLEGLKFTRQKPLLNYIVDFYCSSLLLVIELDGDSHLDNKDYDNQRTADLNKFGIKVIRYCNYDIKNEGIIEDLERKIHYRKKELKIDWYLKTKGGGNAKFRSRIRVYINCC